MFASGYWTIGRVRGAPVRVHWSAPLGAVAFTGFRFTPGLWAGFFLLVVLHELGHAAIVRHLGHRTVAVRVHAFGGDCQWDGNPTTGDVAAVAWGGVAAQGVLWVIATVIIAIVGMPESPVLASLAVTFTTVNAHMMLFNLLPIPPLDGHRAWTLLPILWQSRKEQGAYQRERAAIRKEKDRLARLPRPAGAKQPSLALVPRPAPVARVAAAPVIANEIADEDLAPMPPEVQAVLDRVMRREVDPTPAAKAPSKDTKPEPEK
jgi:hypothetical protein